MVAIAFSAMVILALVSMVVHWTMRIRLMRLDSTRDRIEWLSFRGGDDVLNTLRGSVSSEHDATFLPFRFLDGYCVRRHCPVRDGHAESIWQVIVETSRLHLLTSFQA
jgi:hypothetical protein